MDELGTAYVRVAGDFSQVNSQAVGLFSSSKWKSIGAKAGGALAIGFAAAGAGKLLYDIGAQFDDAFDKIQTKTGATGKELGKLEKSFKDVVTSVPVDFGTAADAVAGLNQRLGLTGKPLGALAKQLAALSKITGEDINESVASTTRLFGDWSVATKDQTDELDKLFRLSQDTGLGISELSRFLVQFGSPLRQLGLDLDFSAAMFARFEREGVNTQTLLPGLRFAIKAFSGATAETTADLKDWGVSLRDPEKGLQQVMELIKDAPTDLKANAIAFEIFGQRAGPDMAAAIREGRFELDDLIEAMNKADETIRDSERSTRDFSEEWLLFKNRVMVWLEPLATTVFTALGDAMKDINRLLKGKGGFADAIKSAADSLKEFWDDSAIFRAAVDFMGDVVKRVLPAIKQMFQGFKQTIKGIVEVISGILTLNFDRAWQGVKDIFGGAIKNILSTLRAATAPFREVMSRIGDAMSGPINAAAETIKDIVNWIISEVLNRIPGVELGTIGGVSPLKAGHLAGSGAPATPGQHRQGSGGGRAAGAARGAYITEPGWLVGEEAPQHPEYVLATNPNYRKRNLELWAKAGRDLGVPGFDIGGFVKGIARTVASPIGAAAGLVDIPSPGDLIGKVKDKVSGLPGWLSGLGSWMLEKLGAYIKDKLSLGLAGGPSGAGAVPRGTLASWLTQALKIVGVFSPANLSALYARAMQESGGNPRAINLWDSNAAAGIPSMGLLQTIGPTFNAYKLPGHGDVWNPIDNAIAAIRYMLSRYGHIVGASSGGYATGGILPPFGGSFRDGGVVPGPIGAPRTIVAHGGERVGSAVEVHLHGPGMDELIDEVYAIVDGEKVEIMRAGGRNLSRARQLVG